MSVHAWTAPAGSDCSASLAARFSRDIDSTAASTAASGARPALIAVAMIPVPSGFVSNSTSPGRAPALAQMRRGWTSPVTA